MVRRLTLLVALASGCDDTLFPAVGGGPDPDAQGWCAVRAMVATQCATCHSASTALGGLDLESDPHGTLLSRVSSFGDALVVPGDPSASLLVKKLLGADGFGGQMPPSGYVGDDQLGKVESWIVDGADDECEGPAPTGGGSGYHPAGWADPAVHGIGAKFQDEPCQSCHGEDLGGGTVGVACADCHDAVVDDWTTTCTFCHGDPEEGSGAPPQDIDDNDDPATITFPAHRKHLSDSSLHAAWSCEQCHATPTSVFSPGHVFVGDDTPGQADLDFSGGLSAGGRATPTGCANVYCHGTGQAAGSISRTATVRCGDCHAVQSTPGAWDQLSDPHERHLDEDIRCSACHPTVNDAGALVDPGPHVDGRRTVSITGLVRGSDGRCTGTCHGETHSARQWADD